MPFTKLDSGLQNSSLMAEPGDVFKAFMLILSITGPDGIARISPTTVARDCYMTQDQADAAIARLESPDPNSRSLDDEGRRIRRVDGGFFVINYQKYRSFVYSDNPESARKREYRERIKSKETNRVKRDMSGTCPGHSASVLSSAFSSVIGKEFLEFWDAYDFKIAKVDAFNAYKALRRSGVTKAEIARALHGYHDFLKDQKERGFDQSKLYPATFLRKERWKDFIGYVHKPKL